MSSINPNWEHWDQHMKALRKLLAEQENMLPYTSGFTKEQCETKIKNLKWDINDNARQEPNKYIN